MGTCLNQYPRFEHQRQPNPVSTYKGNASDVFSSVALLPINTPVTAPGNHFPAPRVRDGLAKASRLIRMVHPWHAEHHSAVHRPDNVKKRNASTQPL